MSGSELFKWKYGMVCIIMECIRSKVHENRRTKLMKNGAMDSRHRRYIRFDLRRIGLFLSPILVFLYCLYRNQSLAVCFYEMVFDGGYSRKIRC